MEEAKGRRVVMLIGRLLTGRRGGVWGGSSSQVRLCRARLGTVGGDEDSKPFGFIIGPHDDGPSGRSIGVGAFEGGDEFGSKRGS